MKYRFAGLVAAFLVIAVLVALRPGVEQTAVALLQTETPTVTTTAATSTSTPGTPSPTVSPTVTTTPGPPGTLVANFPQSACIGPFPPASANVTFSWSGLTNVVAIYVDLSLFDNNFQDGTYISSQQPASTTSFTWNGLVAGQPHFWRVTALGANGQWVSSEFLRFVPCGVARIVGVSHACTGGGLSMVTFRWAPSSSPGFFQFLDLSLQNNGFAPGTFLGAGPLPATQQALIWSGIIANQQHFFRANVNSIFGWSASQTVAYTPVC